MDVEALLQAAADAGMMKEEGEIPEHIRRLWSTYNTVINSPCIGPELRLLQVKNERRQSVHTSGSGSSAEINTNMQQASHARDPMDVDLNRVNEATLISNFNTAQLNYPNPGHRGIYQVCRER